MNDHRHASSLMFKALAKTLKSRLKSTFFSSIRKSEGNYSDDLKCISKAMYQDCYQKYYENNKIFLCDPQSEVHVEVASSILTGHTLVLEATSDTTFAFDFCRDAFFKVFRSPAGNMTHVMLHLSKDPFESMKKNHFFIGMLDKIYGETFEFESASNDDTVDVYIKTCAYLEMFQKAGDPSLTRILCHWDSAWINAINACGKPYTSELKSRMSDGDSRCHYCFHQVKTQ